jgi:bifunctional NMN adenylyltransferase/nudix hydrolase
VQALVAKQLATLSLGVSPKVALCGFKKDASSYYLKLFPQWESVEVKDGNPNIDATDFRSDLYEFEFTALRRWNDAGSVPAGTHLFLRQWLNSSEFSRLRAEYRFMTEYLADFPQTPYPRFFTATDACVIQSGHVLLVRRSQLPGKGLWALPGGHVNMHETFKDAAIRELIEETAIGLPGWSDTGTGPQSREELLRPYVKGSDDASEEQGGCARWWSLDEVTREMMFEDHYNVIQHFANQFRDL